VDGLNPNGRKLDPEAEAALVALRRERRTSPVGVMEVNVVIARFLLAKA
jgi:hypothetical protein